ncbi:retrovirus-related pol polyprotein from transposon TNT 1-94 [Tanacetum coccineum]
MADLNVEYHERALLANQKRFYKRYGKDEESVSLEDEGTTNIKEFMAIIEDELSVEKADARFGQWVDITMRKTCSKVTLDQLLSEQVLGNIVKALGGKGRRKEKIFTKEVVFTKADESSYEPIPEITSDSESECETQKPLPPLLKLIGVEPKRTENKSPTVSDKKADSSTEQLLLTLMEECSTCGSTNHLTKEHIEQTAVNKTLTRLKAQSSTKKAPMIPKPFKECKYTDSMIIILIIMNITLGVKYVVVLLMNQLTVLRNTLTVGTLGLLTSGLLKEVLKKFLEMTLQETQKDMAQLTVMESPLPVLLIKMENLNEVRVKELRSGNGTEFRNHKLEELCDEKGISQNFSSPCNPKQNGIAERRNRTLIKAARTMGRSPDISYFYVFRCPVYIYNHRDHLGKFDEKVDDGFFLSYSLVAKAFRVFNIRRKEMEETVHVTFSEDNEAISQSSTEEDAINFNENTSFPNDEFLEPRSEVTQCPDNIEYFPYIPAYENTTHIESPILQGSVSPEDPPEFTEAYDHPALNELGYPKIS